MFKKSEIDAMKNKNLVYRKSCPKCKDGYYNQNDTDAIESKGMCISCIKEGVK